MSGLVSQFFVWSHAGYGESGVLTDFVETDPVHLGPAPRCPRCGLELDMLTWVPPLYAELETWGGSFGDAAFRGRIDFLVADRLVDLWRRERVSGFTDFDPVEIVRVIRRAGRKPLGPPCYARPRFAATRAAIDAAKSGYRTEGSICPECRQGSFFLAIDRVVIEDGTWAGEDVFRPRGLPSRPVVTKRFRDICTREGITGVCFIPAEEFSLRCEV